MTNLSSGNGAGMSDQPDEQLVTAVRRELDASCRTLDGHTLSRLNSIRHAAIAKAGSRKTRKLLLPFGGLATAFVLVLSISLVNSGRTPETDAPAEDAPLENIDLLTTTESLDFFEDYEFYQWLAENGSSI